MSMFRVEILENKFNNLSHIESPIAIAVSGGPDSMALVCAAQNWAQKRDKKIVALTVDHKLRSNSTKEAEGVKNWLCEKGIEHHILTWQHTDVDSKIQESARFARYTLMAEFCKNNGIENLLTAHHLNDQLETFFMRLTKGSGVQGLCCMRERQMRYGITIARPFLDVASSVLKDYLNSINQPFVEDPSNIDETFERVRWRNLIEPMIQNGLSLDHFSKSLARLQEVDSFIEENVEDAFFDCVDISGKTAEIDFCKLVQLSPVLSKRLLNDVLQTLHPTAYPVSTDALTDCVAQLPTLKSTSLGGCVLTKKSGKIIVTLDPRVKQA